MGLWPRARSARSIDGVCDRQPCLPIFPGRASARSAVLPSFSLGRRCRGATDEGDQHPGSGLSPSPGLRPPSPGGEGKAVAFFFPTCGEERRAFSAPQQKHFSRTRFGAIRDLPETLCLTGRSVGPGSSPGKNELGVGAALSDPLCCLPSPWGEGVAERRMRGISTQAPGCPPHPAFGHPLPGERERRRLFASPQRGEVGRRAAAGRWGRALARVSVALRLRRPLRLALAGDPPPHAVGRKTRPSLPCRTQRAL